jgi:hypothetical protein
MADDSQHKISSCQTLAVYKPTTYLATRDSQTFQRQGSPRNEAFYCCHEILLPSASWLTRDSLHRIHNDSVTTSSPYKSHCTILPLGSFILNEYLAPGQDQYWGKIAVNDCDANAEQTTQTLSLVTQMNKILRTSSSVKYQNIGTQEEQIRLNKQMTCGADTCPPLSNANKIL